MKISEKGIELIKKFEGCQLKAYKCAGGVWTIGYGHTNGVKATDIITNAQATEYLKEDLKKYEETVEKYNKIYNWAQNEFDAMVSFAFNIGNIDQLTAKGTRSSEEITEKMLCYNKAGGKILAGLTKRRKEEKELFMATDIQVQVTFKELVYRLQRALNMEFNAELILDGVAGKKTISSTPDFSKEQSKNKPLTTAAIQALLNYHGCHCGEVDGIWGTKTSTAVFKFQKEKCRLTPDYMFNSGKKSWKKLLNIV